MKQIIDEEARAALKGQGLDAEGDDIRQAAWVAVSEAMTRAHTAQNPGGYIRRAARYGVKQYIKALRRDALGHREG